MRVSKPAENVTKTAPTVKQDGKKPEEKPAQVRSDDDATGKMMPHSQKVVDRPLQHTPDRNSRGGDLSFFSHVETKRGEKSESGPEEKPGVETGEKAEPADSTVEKTGAPRMEGAGLDSFWDRPAKSETTSEDTSRSERSIEDEIRSRWQRNSRRKADSPAVDSDRQEGKKSAAEDDGD